MGIRDKPIAPASPWQNGFAERLIGSIRRECIDHLVVLSEAHLRRMLQAYAGYYNKIRTHRSLDKDAPAFRAVQRIGAITSHPILGGFIIITFGFRFSVHTGIPMPTANKAMAIEPAADLWVRVCPSENARNAEGRCGRVKGTHYQSSEAHT
jgi:hypothetical protein